MREAARLGGRQARHDTPLAEIVDGYRDVLTYKVALEAGERDPRPAHAGWWRPSFVERPMSRATWIYPRTTLDRFRDAVGSLTTGDLSPELLARFLGSILDRGATARTHHQVRTYLRTMFASLTRDSALSLFRVDPSDLFRDEVEALPASKPEIVVHGVDAITAFLAAAERAADPGRVVEVQRKKGGKVETFRQAVSASPSPVLETALLLLCSGMRRGEGPAIRWQDVDLERGRRSPPLPRTAPRLARAGPTAEHVPRDGESGPAFTRAWARVAKAARVDVGPQGCRRTFESALASIGVP